MGDIYFSDKKRSKNNDNENNSNDFIETDYFDEDFSLNFNKSKGNAQSFISQHEERRVTRPTTENEFSDFARADSYRPISEHQTAPGSSHIVNGIDRTPHGRPVSANRTPQGSHAMHDSRPVSSRSEHITDRTPQGRPVPSRQPAGKPVQPHPSAPRVTAPSYNTASKPAAPAHTPAVRTPAQKLSHTPSRPVSHTANHSNDAHSSSEAKSSFSSHNVSARRRNTSWIGKLAIAFFAVIAIAVIGIIGYGFSVLSGLDYDTEIIENRYLDSAAVSDSSLKNILFIGSDARGDVSGQRSDTMILFSIDEKSGQIKLASFLRDSYVYIPLLERKSKINAAFSNGGAQATIDTIEYNYGVDIDNYIIIDFVVFEQIVDLLGGITVEVTEKEAKYMREDVKIPWVKEGENDFNGFVALWYCRIRHLDNDFKRTERQRKVISAVIDKAKSNIFVLPGMVKEVVPNISTDLTKGELLKLGINALFRYLSYDIVQQQIPANGTWSDAYVNGSYVIKFNEEENKRILREFLLNKVETAEKEN